MNPKPTANFQIQQPSSDCAPKVVTLVNSSTGSSPITSWTWVYGDGGTASFTNGASHTYTYTTPGSYTITLQVTDANGCDDQKTLGTVNVITAPVAAISSNPPLLVGCLSNFSAVFSATNSTGNNLTYNWNFGNGQTSTQQTSGSITFSAQTQLYPVTLTVTSQGCSNVTSTFVTVSPAYLGVTVNPVICLGAAFVATINTNQPYSTWQYGSNFAVVMSPVAPINTVLVPAPNVIGPQVITINAGTNPCVASPVTVSVTADQVIANFSGSSPTVSCASPFAVTYQSNSSSNATTFTWSVLNPNNTISTYTGNPVNVAFSGGSNNQYAIFNRPYTPTVTLVAGSNAGCTAAATKTIHSIERPAAWYNMNTREGCAPLAVTLRDSSIVFPSCPVVSYTWYPGSSTMTPVSGTLALPPNTNTRIPTQTFTYTSPGTYSPYLQISTASNYTNTNATCTDLSFTTIVTVVNSPSVSFIAPSGTFCPAQTITITNTSPSQGSVQHWHVESDEGFFSGCVSDPNPGWKFTHVGTHTFALTGFEHSCASTTQAGSVTVKGPIGKVRYETNCNVNRYSVDFSSELQEVATATLLYGDGTQTVFAGNATGNQTVISTHVYQNSGDFNGSLIAVNPATGCAASVFTFVVTVRNVQASIITNPTVCLGQPLAFSAFQSQDVLTGCSRGYLWYQDNLPPEETTGPARSITFTLSGVHDFTLAVKDINGCTATATTSVRVSEVLPQFAFSSQSICLSSGTVQITNQTNTVPDNVAQYFWDFGDGSNLTTTSSAVPTHTYLNATSPQQIYTVSLTAQNVLGCSATTLHTIAVVKPFVFFQASPADFCVPAGGTATVNFVPFAPYSSYTIDYGASPTSTLIASGMSAFAYSLAGTYTVNVKVKATNGCENTGSLTVNGIATPTADFIFSSPHSTGGSNICSGQIVTFTNVSQPQQYNATWNLGAGILQSTNNIVSLFYTAPSNSVVLVTLTVNTGAPANCTSSASRNFTIYVYDADFLMSDSIVCANKPLTFSISPASFGLGAWLWSFGDASSTGTIMTNASPPPLTYTSHIYSNYTATAAGYTSVSLIYWSGDMACRDAKEKLIKVEKVYPYFFRNGELTALDTAHCLRIGDLFTDSSHVNSKNLSLAWKFGDGGSSTQKAPFYTYPKPGNYTVTLVASNEHGCADSLQKTMTVFALPTATILPDTGGYCPARSFNLSMEGSGGVISGTWSPAGAFIPSNIFASLDGKNTISVSISATTDFTLAVTNNSNCVSDPVDTNIVIIQPPMSIKWDTTVVIGEPIPIHVLMDKFVTYTWTPVIKDLSCNFCLNPVSSSTVDVLYTLVMEDKLKCSQVPSTYSIHILPQASVDLPTAFTPNGDGINDVIYADGWGIRDLLYLRIYNRWGQMVFESNELSVGWDGTFKGVPQNMDTYVYQVSVETYIDEKPITKSATFKLIR